MMSRSLQLVSPQQPAPYKEIEVKTDWNKCILCQAITTESLKCPADSTHPNVVAGGYSTLSSNILRFNELNELPISFNLNRLDEGKGYRTNPAGAQCQVAQILSYEIQYHKV